MHRCSGGIPASIFPHEKWTRLDIPVPSPCAACHQGKQGSRPAREFRGSASRPSGKVEVSYLRLPRAEFTFRLQPIPYFVTGRSMPGIIDFIRPLPNLFRRWPGLHSLFWRFRRTCGFGSCCLAHFPPPFPLASSAGTRREILFSSPDLRLEVWPAEIPFIRCAAPVLETAGALNAL